jgi:hypothetical protein
MKLKIHFEFRASLRNFQDLNFWGATDSDSGSLHPRVQHRPCFAHSPACVETRSRVPSDPG